MSENAFKMDKLTEQNIREFSSNNPSGVIVIYGPTGSGKTALSLEVAELIGSEIISVDARQVYRGLDIWTGKITEQEKKWIPHHMLDVVDVTEPFSVVDYRNMASWILQDIQNQWKNPILCGGTWLYLDSLIYERDYMGEKPDTTRRDELEAFREESGNQALWNMLHDMDPTYADMLHVNNYTYIIRGIEIFEKTGKSKLESSHWQKLLYPTLFLTPYTDSPEDRSILYARINERIEKMFFSWLIEETRYILDNLSLWMSLICNNSHCPWLVTIGYREVVQYLKWELSLAECISLVQQHNRNYAKRQITWNKKYGSNNKNWLWS